MRNEKHHLVNYIGNLLKDSDYVYFVSYTGLTVAEISDLRNRLAGAQATCHVLKNALIRKAAELSQIQCIADFELAGGTAVVSGKGDPAAAAKVIIDFGKVSYIFDCFVKHLDWYLRQFPIILVKNFFCNRVQWNHNLMVCFHLLNNDKPILDIPITEP